MSKHRKRNLDVVSGIDEELIDTATKKRVKYFSGSTVRSTKKTRVTAMIAIAATLAVLISVVSFVLVPMMTKNVPVYTGMTVSTESGKLIASNVSFEMLSSVITTEPDATGVSDSVGQTDNKKPNDDILKDKNGIAVEPSEKLYYAKKGETIRITIHFDNPDQYEILSFTLNGIKYGSHMFLEGSDMEELTVNYTIADDAEGLTECTIDAIKYIEGTKIKDVRIGGERTVQIGVYSENQPKAIVENELAADGKISFDVSFEDPLGLVGLSKGKVYAVLADRERELERKELSFNEKNGVLFEGLEKDKYYRALVVADYDAFDGKAFSSHVLYEISLNEYKITYELDGGVNAPGNPDTYLSELKTVIAPPTREGWIFLGWTYDGQTESVTSLSLKAGTHGDLVLRANWEYFIFSLPGFFDNMVILQEYSGDMHVYNPYYNDYRAHKGIDIAMDKDAPVYAMFPGKISRIFEDEELGHCIEIDHGEGYFTLYAGLYSVLPDGIAVGTYVRRGQLIASIGEGGPMEKHLGYHLHLELTVNGEKADPTKYMS